jgi:hypothetical protein
MRFTERDNIGELRKKNAELDLEVCELRKLKEKWVDDSNALADPRIRVCVLEKKNSEALPVPMITDFEDRDEENVGEHENDNDIVEPNPLQSNEPLSKKSKKDQGASSGMKFMYAPVFILKHSYLSMLREEICSQFSVFVLFSQKVLVYIVVVDIYVPFIFRNHL